MLRFPSMNGKGDKTDEFLTIDQAAQLASRSHWSIRLWLRKGLLTRYKSGPTRTIVRRSELLELVRPKKVEGN